MNNTPNVRKARTKSPLINQPGTFHLVLLSINRTYAKVAKSPQLTLKCSDKDSGIEFIDYIGLNYFKRDEENEYILDDNNERQLDVDQSRQMVVDKVEDLLGSMLGIDKGEEFALLYDDDDGLYPTQSISDKLRKSFDEEVYCLDDLVGKEFVAIIDNKYDRLRIVKSYTVEDGLELVTDNTAE